MSEEIVEGRIVHYVLNSGPHAGEHRPAIITRVWGETCVNLQVFTDGGSDIPANSNDQLSPVMWKTSILRDEDAKANNSWHFVERG